MWNFLPEKWLFPLNVQNTWHFTYLAARSHVPFLYIIWQDLLACFKSAALVWSPIVVLWEKTVNSVLLFTFTTPLVTLEIPIPFSIPFSGCRILVYSGIPCIEGALFLWSAVLLLLGPFMVPLYWLWDGQMDQNLMQYSGYRCNVG